MTHRILIVDDDLHIREVIRVALRKAGMTVFEARDGKEALTRFAGDRPDLIVLDIGMPEFDGLDVCREIRKSSDVPILFLSARDDEIDRVLGLEIGGDDYVTKPFSPRELVARIRAVLRRMPGEGQSASGLILWGPLRLDLRARRADIADRDLELTSAELRILELLVRADTRTVTRDELMTQALGRRLLPTDRSLDTHVSNLRRKLMKHTDRVTLQSVRGSGYALTLAPARAPASQG